MLWTILVVLLILWLLGFSFHIGGGLIHILLVVALAVLVFNLITGRRRVLSRLNNDLSIEIKLVQKDKS